jgi:CheY-like chemotaxis protein
MTRILVADDDRTTRLLLSETLREHKYTVVAVNDGSAALKKIKEGKFDLVLMDVWMPKLNGLEVLAKLKNVKKRPKIIVMTSDDTPETLLRAIREEAYTYVAKPVDPKALAVLVKETLSKTSKPQPIEVVSASPTWVELLVPCSLDEAERIEAFMAHLKSGLSEDVKRAVGQAFHELLLNAVEWGGKLDPNRKVRISYLRARRMLMYRIAGVQVCRAGSRGDFAYAGRADEARRDTSKEGAAARRFWIGFDAGERRRTSIQRKAE